MRQAYSALRCPDEARAFTLGYGNAPLFAIRVERFVERYS